jgi:hypothetical protein
MGEACLVTETASCNRCREAKASCSRLHEYNAHLAQTEMGLDSETIQRWLEERKAPRGGKGKGRDSGKRKRKEPEEAEKDDETQRDSEEDEEVEKVVEPPKKVPKRAFVAFPGTNSPCFRIPVDEEAAPEPSTSSGRVRELELEVGQLREALKKERAGGLKWQAECEALKKTEGRGKGEAEVARLEGELVQAMDSVTELRNELKGKFPFFRCLYAFPMLTIAFFLSPE